MKKQAKKSGTKPRGRKSDPIKFIAPLKPNDHIIRDAIDLGLSESGDSSAILAILQRHPQNVDTILDEDERLETIAQLISENKMTEAPTDEDRVARVLDFVVQSSSEKGEQAWLELLSPDRSTLESFEDYQALLRKRLLEQIRGVRRKVRDQSRREAKIFAEHSGNDVDATLAISWDKASDDVEIIERIPTGNQQLDEFFGYDEIETPNGKKIKIGGMTAGHTYIVGAPHGMGKTRWLVDLLARLCGKPLLDEHGRTFGGMCGLYIQGEETPSRFASMFADGLWKKGEHDIHLSDKAVFMTQHESLIKQLRPDIVVIDSKDIMEDWKHPSAAKRNAKMYNDWATEYGFVLFVISHVNQEGKIKGGSDLPHMFRAEILGARVENDPSMFYLRMGKNRGSQGGGVVHYKHGTDTVHIVDPSSGDTVIKSEMCPDAAMLSGSATAAANQTSTTTALLSSIRTNVDRTMTGGRRAVENTAQ